MDFDATSLQGAMNAPAQTLTAAPLPTQPAAASRALASSRTAPAPTPAFAQQPAPSHAAVNAIPACPTKRGRLPTPTRRRHTTFPTAPAADAMPFAHILGQDAAPPSARAYASPRPPTPRTLQRTHVRRPTPARAPRSSTRLRARRHRCAALRKRRTAPVAAQTAGRLAAAAPRRAGSRHSTSLRPRARIWPRKHWRSCPRCRPPPRRTTPWAPS